MVLKPYLLRGFKTLFCHRKAEGRGLKSYEKIAFSALPLKLKQKRNCLLQEATAPGWLSSAQSQGDLRQRALQEAAVSCQLLGSIRLHKAP